MIIKGGCRSLVVGGGCSKHIANGGCFRSWGFKRWSLKHVVSDDCLWNWSSAVLVVEHWKHWREGERKREKMEVSQLMCKVQ